MWARWHPVRFLGRTRTTLESRDAQANRMSPFGFVALRHGGIGSVERAPAQRAGGYRGFGDRRRSSFSGSFARAPASYPDVSASTSTILATNVTSVSGRSP